MKFKRLCTLALGLAFLAGLSAAALAQDQVVLRMNLRQGQTYLIHTRSAQTIAQTVQGKEITIHQSIGMTMTYRVESIAADGASTIRLTYAAMQFQQDGPTGKFAYDSTQPAAATYPGAQVFTSLIGQSLTIVMDPLGKVRQVQGVNALMEKMLQQLGEKVPANVRESIIAGFKEKFGDEAIKETFANMVFYPEQPVGVGDSWVQRVNLTRGYPMIVEGSCALRERKDGFAVLEMQARIQPNEQAQPLKVGNVSLQYRLSGSTSGSFRIAEATGMVASGRVLQKLAGRMELLQPDGALQMAIPMRIESTTDLEMTEQSPN
jgi:hypothetical protein